MNVQESIIPQWLKDSIEHKCPYCSSDLQVGLSPDGKRATKLYCPNDECPGILASKAEYMWELLRVSGIKFGNSLKSINSNGIKHHLDLIPIHVKGTIKIDVVTFMRILCVPDIDKKWNSLCSDIYSLEELMASEKIMSKLSKRDIEAIKRVVDKFDIVFPIKQENEAIIRENIMITGNVNEFSSKEAFVATLNAYFKGYVSIGYSPTLRKTGINALISENGSATTRKMAVAKECGIKVYTSQEYLIYLYKKLLSMGVKI